MASTITSPHWLPGGHLQTIVPLLRKGVTPPYRRERIETADGDFVDFDWLSSGSDTTPLVVLFHGLEGSSRSHYARSLMRAVQTLGWRGVVPHFRGCSGEPNRLLRAYHSGDSDEIDWMLRLLRTRAGSAPLFASGVSLGGNALLKWLGEQAQHATNIVDAAVSVCAPLDLAISGHALGSGFNILYTRHFLKTLVRKAEHKHLRHPGEFDIARARTSRTLHAFDDAFTAPVHGYSGADDYWQRASSKPWLARIQVPTLIINPRNDPFVPASAWPLPSELPSAVSFECPPGGGHVGFLTGNPPGKLNWLPDRILAHFRAQPHVAYPEESFPVLITLESKRSFLR